MGPQKSREVYRVRPLWSNPCDHQPMAGALGCRASQPDLRYHGVFL
jgi:hypothetical protein